MDSTVLHANSKVVEIMMMSDKEKNYILLSKHKGNDVSFVSVLIYNTKLIIDN